MIASLRHLNHTVTSRASGSLRAGAMASVRAGGPGIAFSAQWVRFARAQWLRFARAQWVRFARAQWVRFVIDVSPFLTLFYDDLEIGFAQRLWHHFLTRLGSISGALGFASSARKQRPRPRPRYEHAARASACIRARSAPQRRRTAGHDTNTNRRPGAQTRPASAFRIHRLGNCRGASRESWKVEDGRFRRRSWFFSP